MPMTGRPHPAQARSRCAPCESVVSCAKMRRDPVRSARTAAPSGVGVTAEVEISDTGVLLTLSGPNGELLKVLGEETGVGVGLRGNSILLSGEAERVALAERFIAEAASLLRSGTELDQNDYVRGLRT